MGTDRTFQDWLGSEIERSGLSYSEIARRGNITHGRISQVMAGDQPGSAFCVGIARGLDLPPALVLEKAGIIPPEPGKVEREQQALSLFRRLPQTLRDSVIAMMQALLGHRPRQGLFKEEKEGSASPVDHQLELLIHDLESLPPDDQRRVIELLERLRDQRIKEQGNNAVPSITPDPP